MLGPTIEPLINLSLPKGFKNFQFLSRDLGRDPIKVDRITVHRRHHNSVALDMDVSFVGTPNLQMRCFPVPDTFGIRELRWSGRLSILMRPLITTMPLVGAVQAAMVTHPTLDIDFTGMAQVADLGPLAKVVRNVLRQVIASMVVLPNRFVFKMSDAIDFFDVYYPPLGVMQVIFKKGRGFQKERKLGPIKTTPDVFVKGKFGLEKFRTPHVRNSLTPEWNVGHTFILYDLDQPLDVKIMDKDAVRDDTLGERQLLARELIREHHQWVKPNKNVNQTVAINSEILIETNLFIFSEPTAPLPNSQCVVSVLIDRASNLPSDVSYTLCKIHIGEKITRETFAVVKMDSETEMPVPGYDPVNPIWSQSFDVICKSPSEADVTLEVFDKKRRLGKFTINSADLQNTADRTKAGDFSIGNGGTLRAKVLLRGLLRDTSIGAGLP